MTPRAITIVASPSRARNRHNSVRPDGEVPGLAALRKGYGGEISSRVATMQATSAGDWCVRTKAHANSFGRKRKIRLRTVSRMDGRGYCESYTHVNKNTEKINPNSVI